MTLFEIVLVLVIAIVLFVFLPWWLAFILTLVALLAVSAY